MDSFDEFHCDAFFNDDFDADRKEGSRDPSGRTQEGELRGLDAS